MLIKLQLWAWPILYFVMSYKSPFELGTTIIPILLMGKR